MTRREIDTSQVGEKIDELIHHCSFHLPKEVSEKYIEMQQKETLPIAKNTMDVIIENSNISKNEVLPLCQDCGVTIVLLEIGQNVSLVGDYIEDVINDAVANSYAKNNLRKSVVSDPLERKNTGTNTPAFIHTEIVPGDAIKITVYLKGGGSENMTSLRMFRPTDSIDIIVDYIEETVINAGPNPCPPLFLGIGIGGTADVATLNAKKAVLRGVNSKHKNEFYDDLEDKIFEKLNKTNVGPLGFGGVSTVGGVYIKEAPTHIATLPVALNLNCHSFRFKEITI